MKQAASFYGYALNTFSGTRKKREKIKSETYIRDNLLENILR